MCPSGKLERRSRGLEAGGRQSSTPEKFDTQDDGDGDDDKVVEDEVVLTRKSSVLPKSKKKRGKILLKHVG